MDIEKTIAGNSDKYAEIEVLTKQLQTKTAMLTNESRDEIILRQIEKLQAVTNSEAYWNHVLNKKVSALMLQMQSGNEKKYDDILTIKKRIAELQTEASSTRGAFETLGVFFGIGEKTARVIFLICLSVMLEIMVYGSSTATIQKTKKKTLKRKQKKEIKDQIRMVM